MQVKIKRQQQRAKQEDAVRSLPIKAPNYLRRGATSDCNCDERRSERVRNADVS